MASLKSMDLFGQALYDHWKKSREPIYFSYLGNKKARSVKRYFRSPSKLTTLEKELISLAYGKILDIGCATGYYIPALMKQGSVEAIDISPSAIKVANQRKLSNCHCADIFNFKSIQKYDTVTLLENNLGLGGSIEKVKELLTILSSLLKSNGQILLIQRNIKKEWLVSELTIEYKGQQEIFKWLHVSSQKIKEICKELNLNFEILQIGRKQLYLAKIIKM